MICKKKSSSFIIIAFLLSLIGVDIDFSYQDHHNTYDIKTLPLHTGIESLPPTPGAWNEHIYRAHLQAHLWAQDHILHPTFLDPTTLGWENVSGTLKPILSSIQLAPESVIELLKCSCDKSKCSSARCTCRQNNLSCTELCKGESNETCEKMTTTVIEDEED